MCIPRNYAVDLSEFTAFENREPLLFYGNGTAQARPCPSLMEPCLKSKQFANTGTLSVINRHERYDIPNLNYLSSHVLVMGAAPFL